MTEPIGVKNSTEPCTLVLGVQGSVEYFYSTGPSACDGPELISSFFDPRKGTPAGTGPHGDGYSTRLRTHILGEQGPVEYFYTTGSGICDGPELIFSSFFAG